MSWSDLYPHGGPPQRPQPTLNLSATAGSQVPVLMSWGHVSFEVWPLNFDEMDHETASDWAQKEIAGAAIYREWVGENDETRYLRGKLFPYRIGGMAEIEIMDAWRRAGFANLLTGGDGRNLGWFVCEKLVRNHTYISSEGIGQQIAFEAVMTRVPVPSAAEYFPNIWMMSI